MKLITHYHGDHIGRISQALPGIPIHTEEPKEFQKLFKNTLLLKDGEPYEPE